ncbi:MAG: hypothetical protein R2939_14880 [Kofleriaceae bacterium]
MTSKPSLPVLRHSARRGGLPRGYLAGRLVGALGYHRLAGDFRAALPELTVEPIASLARVELVCSSGLPPSEHADVERSSELRARLAAWTTPAVGWRRLHEVVARPTIEIRWVPGSEGLLGGIAALIRRAADPSAVLGVTSASGEALLWEDPSPQAVAWMADEFAAAWRRATALPPRVYREVASRAGAATP